MGSPMLYIMVELDQWEVWEGNHKVIGEWNWGIYSPGAYSDLFPWSGYFLLLMPIAPLGNPLSSGNDTLSLLPKAYRW